eukprot:848216-Pyramimonas_sp.AAC.1
MVYCAEVAQLGNLLPSAGGPKFPRPTRRPPLRASASVAPALMRASSTTTNGHIKRETLGEPDHLALHLGPV